MAITSSASSIIFFDFSTPIFSISSVVFLIPAVSISFNDIPFIVTNSSIVSLVVPFLSLTIALSSFKILFNNEDFPAFGLPTIAVFIPSLKTFPFLNEELNFSSLIFITLITDNILLLVTSSISYSG